MAQLRISPATIIGIITVVLSVLIPTLIFSSVVGGMRSQIAGVTASVAEVSQRSAGRHRDHSADFKAHVASDEARLEKLRAEVQADHDAITTMLADVRYVKAALEAVEKK